MAVLPTCVNDPTLTLFKFNLVSNLPGIVQYKLTTIWFILHITKLGIQSRLCPKVLFTCHMNSVSFKNALV
jgi:hypothetical protein